MLKVLSLAALGLVAVASAAVAAEEGKAAPAAPAAAPTAAEKAMAPAAAPTFEELKDGTKVKIEGTKAFVVDKAGKETPAPDGTHVLKNGKNLVTKGGMVVSQ